MVLRSNFIFRIERLYLGCFEHHFYSQCVFWHLNPGDLPVVSVLAIIEHYVVSSNWPSFVILFRKIISSVVKRTYWISSVLRWWSCASAPFHSYLSLQEVSFHVVIRGASLPSPASDDQQVDEKTNTVPGLLWADLGQAHITSRHSSLARAEWCSPELTEGTSRRYNLQIPGKKNGIGEQPASPATVLFVDLILTAFAQLLSPFHRGEKWGMETYNTLLYKE